MVSKTIKKHPKKHELTERNLTPPAEVFAKYMDLFEKIKSDMVFVEGGIFLMGTTKEQFPLPTDSRGTPERSPHAVNKVRVNSFYISKYEVTQELWEIVMECNPSLNSGGRHPVEFVSWESCIEFINRLNEITGESYRLPTEAEWEYAARGGNKSQGFRFSGSNSLSDVANCFGKNHLEVGAKKSNELGIYDMTGNVKEWCQDYYSEYKESSLVIDNPCTSNEKNAAWMPHHVFRGGSYKTYPDESTVSWRYYDTFSSSGDVGFRLVMSVN